MMHLAIDFGTSETKIYLEGNGIVLAEPTCAAVSAGTREVRAVGAAARKLNVGASDLISFVRPVAAGGIVDPGMAAAILSSFLNKIGIPRRKARRCTALFSVPCGASNALLGAYASVAQACGLGTFRFIEAPILAAIGQGMALGDERPAFVVDIGAATANIAAVTSDGIAAGIGIGLGGGKLDADIADMAKMRMGVHIGPLTAERVKLTVASLYAGDNVRVTVRGKELLGGRGCQVTFSSADLDVCVRRYGDLVSEYIRLVLDRIPPRAAAFAMRRGIRLSGGGARLVGLDEYCAQALNADVVVAKEPQLCVVRGGGLAVADPALLDTLSIEY